MLKLALIVCLAVGLPQVLGGDVSGCPNVSSDLCAIVYEKEDCEGDWGKEIKPSTKTYFRIWSKYRNDIESVSVRKGCTLTGYDDEYEGDFIVIKADSIKDRKLNLGDETEFEGLKNDIESLKCICQ